MSPKQAATIEPASEVKAEAPKQAAEERAKFDKAMDKVDAAREAEDNRVPPEEVWRPAQKKAEKEEPVEASESEEARERDESGRFKAKAEEKEQADEPDDAEYERAQAALLRSGFKAKELSTMPRDELLKRGLKRAKALEADDEAHLHLKLSRNGSGDTSGKSEKKVEAVSTEPDFPALDLKGVTKPLIEKGLLDDQGASALDEVLKKVAESAQSPLLQRIGELEKQLNAHSQGQVAATLETTRKELSGTFPGLAEPETWASVYEEMQEIAGNKRYRQIPTEAARFKTVMEDAARNLRLEAEDSGAAEKRSADADKAKRRNGRSTVNDRSRPVPTNARDAERQRFNDIMDRHEANA